MASGRLNPWGRGRKHLGSLTQGVVFCLYLLSQRAHALQFVISNRTPCNITASNSTSPPFSLTTGGATTSPWNTTTGSATATSLDSTTTLQSATKNSTTTLPSTTTDSTTILPPTTTTVGTTASATATVPATPPDNRTPIQLIVANSCAETIWPGVVTQSGIAPAAGGFELAPGASQTMFVSADWAGRIWGRTNCSFNADGSGPSMEDGVDGLGAACMTGDCLGKLNCQFTGQVPTTLAEFTLSGGASNTQTFYDISLVDGYNLPLAIIHHAPPNTPSTTNMTNPACIASPNYLPPLTATDPSLSTTPFEQTQTPAALSTWCPPSLRKPFPHPPSPNVTTVPPHPHQQPHQTAPHDTSPGDWALGFQPCLSSCSATGSPADCCTGRFGSPEACRPGAYSAAAKRVCPDAYSYAFDDGESTFVVAGGAGGPGAAGGGVGGGGNGVGWEVRFCPKGWRSTEILEVEEREGVNKGGRKARKGGEGEGMRGQAGRVEGGVSWMGVVVAAAVVGLVW
ncbi:Osmotin, thaumatin-like protein [Staphylotrichum tortipilum]|uniref:Osmotin, thaumatin-like protein n=1 Tax=Staphylotrichum tortipilum TaxID=2831512 RepID=A0AAN6MNX0_9PEZI|nr:Osmotin, thaumatin-like protein [Staphylotrichum longicolle]